MEIRRARSVTGPLRRAHPASGATWNVQVVRGKMSTTCLWHACRALSAGLLLMLLGAAMATIGYYADTLSVAQEVRGNATISVKDEARGFHLNNLSYAGPIVMGFGGFIVVAACVMTFEARDSAAKVTPARPQSLPRPVVATTGAARRTTACAPARLDQLGIYRLPHVLPLPHALPLPPLHSRHHRPLLHDPRTTHKSGHHNSTSIRARFGSAPDLHAGHTRATLSVSALRRPFRRYALSVDEPPPTAVSASAAESECGSQSSLALDLHGGGACGAVTLRVRDNTRRRPLARQQRLHDDLLHTSGETSIHINSIDESPDDDETEEANPAPTSQTEEIRSITNNIHSPQERYEHGDEQGEQHSKDPEETQESSSDTSNDCKTITAVDTFEVIDEKPVKNICNDEHIDSTVTSPNIDTEHNQTDFDDTSAEVKREHDPD